jgi:APA family basic amino acid/polyamine antiporter
MPYAAAKDGLFLQHFGKISRRDVPWFGIVVSTIVATALMAFSYGTTTGLDVFNDLVYLSVVTVAIPYFISACAQLAFLVSRRRAVEGWRLTRDLAIVTASGLFALWVTFAQGYAAVYHSLVLLLIGLPLYAFLKARRERLGQAPEPVDVVGDMPAATVSLVN